ncbi:hypothetical protein FB451DRAFT_1268335, partial [Mycena latifolia]
NRDTTAVCHLKEKQSSFASPARAKQYRWLACSTGHRSSFVSGVLLKSLDISTSSAGGAPTGQAPVSAGAFARKRRCAWYPSACTMRGASTPGGAVGVPNLRTQVEILLIVGVVGTLYASTSSLRADASARKRSLSQESTAQLCMRAGRVRMSTEFVRLGARAGVAAGLVSWCRSNRRRLSDEWENVGNRRRDAGCVRKPADSSSGRDAAGTSHTAIFRLQKSAYQAGTQRTIRAELGLSCRTPFKSETEIVSRFASSLSLTKTAPSLGRPGAQSATKRTSPGAISCAISPACARNAAFSACGLSCISTCSGSGCGMRSRSDVGTPRMHPSCEEPAYCASGVGARKWCCPWAKASATAQANLQASAGMHPSCESDEPRRMRVMKRR